MKNKYLEEVNELKSTIPEWVEGTFFNDHVDDGKKQEKKKTTTKKRKISEEGREEEVKLMKVMTREQNWIRLEVLGQPLVDKYAWAIPDERSLGILAHFSPLIEIGAGKGYWASLLLNRGVDILAFDKIGGGEGGQNDDSNWTEVKKGGPKLLAKPKYAGRNLFLCYPDEGSSMSIKCLEHFTGDYIVHVGELMNMGGTISGAPQAPFGRTTSAEFTVALAETFHCLLKASIPRLPFSNDCITVWKRTQWVEGRSSVNDDDEEEEVEEEEGGGGGGGEGSEQDKNYWADIPASERMPTDQAAPCLDHLLSVS